MRPLLEDVGLVRVTRKDAVEWCVSQKLIPCFELKTCALRGEGLVSVSRSPSVLRFCNQAPEMDGL